MTDAALPSSIDELQALLARELYVADRGLATSIYLALRLHRPLLLEGEAGLILVDQHAAHERVLYERLRAQWLSAGVERQGLLLPITVGLDARSVAAVREGTDAALRLGFELEPFGEDTVIVRAVPALLTDRDPAELVRELAHELGEERPEEPGAEEAPLPPAPAPESPRRAEPPQGLSPAIWAPALIVVVAMLLWYFAS